MLKSVAAAGLVLAAVTAAAQAADPGFCRDYATAAARQARTAHEIPPCRPGAIGPRWTENYRVHFNWCLGAPFAAAERERAIRTEHLRDCR